MMNPENSLNWTQIVAERRIEEAMEQGVFDNLPGKGKPINLDEDAGIPPHLRIVHHVMKNARVVPHWVALENEIEKAKASAIEYKETVAALASRTSDNDLANARREYERLMRSANDLILRFNLINPFVHRAPVPFRIAERLEDWDQLFGEPSAMRQAV